MAGRWKSQGSCIAATFAVAALSLSQVTAQQPGSAEMAAFSSSELQAFSAIHPIDAHSHIYMYTPEYLGMLSKLGMHALDIMVVSDNAHPERKDLAKESRDVFELVQKSNHQVFACTTFDAYRFNQPDFVQHAVAGLDEAFAQGAVAVKVWKNIGLQIKDPKGNYIMPDDPKLKPIYREIAAKHKTLVMHIADPDTAFEPPNPNAADKAYYIEHPEWYIYKIPGAPTKDQVLEARDHVLRDNPDLKVVGAHLGSMEGDFKRIAKDLDRYQNFAVDLTARMPYIMKLPRAEAIAFMTKYQDRLIYGTDQTFYPDADIKKFVQSSEATYARDWRFLSTEAKFSSRGIKSQGLALPPAVLRKIYHDNAVHWYQGIQ